MSGAGDAGGTRAASSGLATWLTAYGIAAVVFAVVDVFWLGVVAQPLYNAQLGHLLADEFNLGAAAAFYLLYLVGLVHFAIRPLEPPRPLRRTLLDAGLYGFFTYMTWDLTSMAVFRDFPLVVVLVDVTWGTSVCILIAAVTVWVMRRIRARRG
ncbi:MAG: DUF2177 family protein [Actinobacteria bacterium]|nr:DUF2177 family protein [Actinomycetota bacterium]